MKGIEEVRGLAAQEKPCCLYNVSTEVLVCQGHCGTADSAAGGAGGILCFIPAALQQRSFVITWEPCPSFPWGSNSATLPSFSFSSFLHLPLPAGRSRALGR